MRLIIIGISFLVMLALGGYYFFVKPLDTTPSLDIKVLPEQNISIETQVSSTTTTSPFLEQTAKDIPIATNSNTVVDEYKNNVVNNNLISNCPDLDQLTSKYIQMPVQLKEAFGIVGAREGIDDSDGDCLLDAFEVEQCFLACDPNQAVNLSGVNEFNTDYDSDGLTTGVEQSYGTSPVTKDTDMDDLSDKEEVILGTDPLVIDSDNDGIKDGTEVTFNLNPKIADADSVGVYPATWNLDNGIEVTFYVKNTAREVIAFGNSMGNAWDPHNHVSWRQYSLAAIDYAVYFNSEVMVDKVTIKNPAGEVFIPVYFLGAETSSDFSEIALPRYSTIDEVVEGKNVHYIGKIIRSFALTDNITQFQLEEESKW